MKFTMIALTLSLGIVSNAFSKEIQTAAQADNFVFKAKEILRRAVYEIQEKDNVIGSCYILGEFSQLVSDTNISGSFINAGTLKLKLEHVGEMVKSQQESKGFCHKSSSADPESVAQYLTEKADDLYLTKFH